MRQHARAESHPGRAPEPAGRALRRDRVAEIRYLDGRLQLPLRRALRTGDALVRNAQAHACRMSESAERALPGDLPRDELIRRMIRVDHAGEYGARRIYEGQLAVL